MAPATIKRLFLGVLASLSLAASAAAQGIVLPGVGPVNESMAGAAVAAPLDAAGAIHWNPATLSGLRRNEASWGMNLILPDARVGSTIGPFGLSGSSRSESGVTPIPSMALAYLPPENPRLTYGIGVFGIAGFRTNYDADPNNPILAPQGMLGPIPSLGRVNAEAEFCQVVPSVSYAVNNQWSIGVAPTLTLARIQVEPVFVAPPTGGVYPQGMGTRYHFGGGFQLGAYYLHDSCWHFGASIKSPQWFEGFRFKSQDALGNPVRTTFDLDYPMIISVGTAYHGLPNMMVAADVRYLDYKHAAGFGTSGFNPDGSAAGLGWRSVVAVATGVQYQLHPGLIIRAGYMANRNPISSDNVIMNVGSPLITQHLATIGTTVDLAANLKWSLTYLHAFDSEKTGPYATVPDSTITLRTAAYGLSSGVTVHW